MTSLVVFDTNRKCFVAELLLRVQGNFSQNYILDQFLT